ncbi:MAG: flavin oxidoreductase, partial [Christensenellaceae bacterium]|nr:flavin oxidoreductase [Christensenellaceae bacterium]
IADASNVVAADYVGVVSGNDVPDKLLKTGWHTCASKFVDAPIIEELPMTLECRMESYDEEDELLIGQIVNVSADEKILTDGKIDPAKLRPITYDPAGHTYVVLGEKVGNAFFDGKQLK